MTAQVSPSLRQLRLNLGSWVQRLTLDFPGFDEYDLSSLIEEKTGVPLDRGDFEMVRALYLRSKLRAWQPVPEDGEE